MIAYDEEARRALERGMDRLAGAVKVTLGPRGRYVSLERKWGPPLIVNDGVTIATEIDLEDPYENLGAQLVKEVAKRTEEVAGDGTTTATVLAQKMIKLGLSNVVAGANPIEIKRGIEKAVEVCVGVIAAAARDVAGHNDVANVASISANNDMEIGARIADAIDKVGREGVITVEESNTFGLELEIVEGMRLDKGFISPYFITDPERMEALIEDPYILIANQKVAAVKDLVPVLDKVLQAGKPLLVIADDVEGEALAVLVVNKMRGALQAAAVKAPGFGDRRKELLGDVAALIGGQVVSEELGVKLGSVTLEMLGRAHKVIVTKDDTTIVGGRGDAGSIEARIGQIKGEMERSDSDHDREKLQERLAKLSGGIAVIKVGAPTEVELKETKHRIEDAVRTTKAALEEGIVAGGGVALLACQEPLEKLELGGDRQTGVRIVRLSLEEPMKVIAANAGLEPGVVVDHVRKLGPGEGLDVATERYTDLFTAGVIDAAKVTRSALQNAASIAALFLTTEAIVAEKPEERSDQDTG